MGAYPQKILSLRGLSLGGALFFVVSGMALIDLYFDPKPVLIHSFESSTKTEGPVFNRIMLQAGGERDIWLMQQRRGEKNHDFHGWDKLAIVVDKKTTPNSARFYQLESGNLNFDPSKEINYRVSCGICHSNGPRAIRPMPQSMAETNLSWAERVKIELWNFRIKTYGKLNVQVSNRIGADQRKIPFKFSGDFANQKLAIHTCLKCHNNSSWGRGSLSLQNFPSVRFLVEHNIMPPLGFSLSDGERKSLEIFLSGAQATNTSENLPKL